MSLNITLIEARKAEALNEIKFRFGKELDEYVGTLFVEHHIKELDSSYWQKHLNTTKPNPKDILDILVLKSHCDEDAIFDFTLPGDVTDSVISVSFDTNGEIEDITMES
jgi:hypothetical protein